MFFKVVTIFVAVLFAGLLFLGLRQRDWKFVALNFAGMALNSGVVILDMRAQFDIIAAIVAFLILIVIFIADIFLLSREPEKQTSGTFMFKTASMRARHPESQKFALITSEKRFRRELLAEPQNDLQQALQHWQQGNTSFQQGNMDDAENQYKYLVRLAPTPTGLNNLGVIFLATDRADLALQRLARACQLDPELLEAWLNRGRALLALKRFSEALATFDQAVALQPNMLEPWIFRANTLVQLGQYEAAVQNYDAALCLNANRAECWNNRGVAFSKMSKWPEAAASFERALKIQAEYYPASLNRVLAIERLGRFDQARQQYRHFLKQPPPAVNGNLVLVRSRLQQLESGAPGRPDFPPLEFELAA